LPPPSITGILSVPKPQAATPTPSRLPTKLLDSLSLSLPKKLSKSATQKKRRGEATKPITSIKPRQRNRKGGNREATTTLPCLLPLQKTNRKKKKKAPQKYGGKKTEKNERNSGRTWV
jgi:hypothetical protein